MTNAKQFQEQGYVILKNWIDPKEVENLYRYTVDRMEKGNIDDGQVPGSYSFYQDAEVSRWQKNLLPKIEAEIQMKLLPVFCYHRVYKKGAVLRMHKDSPRAEISATINLGQVGEPWDLWLVDYNENTQRITLNPGEALIYYGNRLHHWRGKLEQAELVSQIMFHFVDKNGKNTSASKLEVIRKLRKRCRQLFGIAY